MPIWTHPSAYASNTECLQSQSHPRPSLLITALRELFPPIGGEITQNTGQFWPMASHDYSFFTKSWYLVP